MLLFCLKDLGLKLRLSILSLALNWKFGQLKRWGINAWVL
jgi:hypothetical protein